MGRYVRDEILHKALDLLQAATVNNHDRPGGVLDQNAFCISWLQEALDSYHAKFPFAGDVLNVSMTMQSNNPDLLLTSDTTLNLPTNFIVDCRDGVMLTINGQTGRLKRKSFQNWLDIYNASTTTTFQYPFVYTVIGRPKAIKIAPVVSTIYTTSMWYFAQPSVLDANDYPEFPNEWALVEFVRIKGGELIKRYDPGTASKFLDLEMAKLKAAGLIHEAEYDQVPIEGVQYIDNMAQNRNSWMGNIAI